MRSPTTYLPFPLSPTPFSVEKSLSLSAKMSLQSARHLKRLLRHLNAPLLLIVMSFGAAITSATLSAYLTSNVGKILSIVFVIFSSTTGVL